MAGLLEIHRGTVERVEVKVVQAGMYRKWVAEFTLDGQQMFFVSCIDVSIFARNQPDICKSGDRIIVAGSMKSYSMFRPDHRPGSELFEARAIHDLSTGQMTGDKGS